MNAKDFTKHWKKEHDNLLAEYTSGSKETSVSKQIEELGLSDEQRIKIKSIISGVLTDTFYSLLLGLDGSASIGGLQHTFKVYDEDNNLISDCGDLEAEAYEQFHGN